MDTTFTSIKDKINRPIILNSNISNTKGIQLVVYSILLAFAIVVFISSSFNIIIGLSVLILAVLFYLLFINYGNNAGIPYALQ
jgi:hypothetical protein